MPSPESSPFPLCAEGLPQIQVLRSLPASLIINGSAFSDLVLFIIKRNPILPAIILFPMLPRDGIHYNGDNHFPVSSLI